MNRLGWFSVYLGISSLQLVQASVVFSAENLVEEPPYLRPEDGRSEVAPKIQYTSETDSFPILETRDAKAEDGNGFRTLEDVDLFIAPESSLGSLSEKPIEDVDQMDHHAEIPGPGKAGSLAVDEDAPIPTAPIPREPVPLSSPSPEVPHEN